jgi:YHS domain-containing protein
MQDLFKFVEKIEGKLAVDKERTEAYRQGLYQQHEIRNERMVVFAEEAHRIFDVIIRPRMEKLVGFFGNASLTLTDDKGENAPRCKSVFESTPRVPAEVSFEFAISHDTEIKMLRIVCNQEILPIFLKYQPQDILSVNPSATNTEQIETWVETKILSFLDIYFQLARVEQYQRGNLVYDPVCGIQINKAFVIEEASFETHQYYFCTGDCREKFIADPARYKLVKGS